MNEDNAPAPEGATPITWQPASPMVMARRGRRPSIVAEVGFYEIELYAPVDAGDNCWRWELEFSNAHGDPEPFVDHAWGLVCGDEDAAKARALMVASRLLGLTEEPPDGS